MTYQIHEVPFTAELQKHIVEALDKEALESTGINVFSGKRVIFEIQEKEAPVGYIVVQILGGQLHIKSLIVDKMYRNKGYGSHLINYALAYGKSQGCTIAFVETMNFQAPHFYKKLGFSLDMRREGYAQGTSFHFFRKSLGEADKTCIIKEFCSSDTEPLATAFQKPITTFETYLQEQLQNDRILWVAYLDNQLAGYVTLKWQSPYHPFATACIPEIMDLNVLSAFRKKGIGTKLLEKAEKEASTISDLVGIRVGLYGGPNGGYGSAQRLYITRGYVPDGRGVTYKCQPTIPGNSYPLDDELLLSLTKKLN